MVSLLAFWVDPLGLTTPDLDGPLSPKSISMFGDNFMVSRPKWHRNYLLESLTQASIELAATLSMG